MILSQAPLIWRPVQFPGFFGNSALGWLLETCSVLPALGVAQGARGKCPDWAATESEPHPFRVGYPDDLGDELE